MPELEGLIQVIVIEAVAMALVQVPVRREDHDLHLRAVRLGLPEREETITIHRRPHVSLWRRSSVLLVVRLLVRLELHVKQHLAQVEVNLVYILVECEVFGVFILSSQLIHRVKHQVLQASMIASIAGHVCGHFWRG